MVVLERGLEKRWFLTWRDSISLRNAAIVSEFSMIVSSICLLLSSFSLNSRFFSSMLFSFINMRKRNESQSNRHNTWIHKAVSQSNILNYQVTALGCYRTVTVIPSWTNKQRTHLTDNILLEIIKLHFIQRFQSIWLCFKSYNINSKGISHSKAHWLIYFLFLYIMNSIVQCVPYRKFKTFFAFLFVTCGS